MSNSRRSIILIGSLGIVFLLFGSARGGALLKVNSTNFGFNCDQQLSLEEAVSIATGLVPFGRPLTNGEKNQITGANIILAPGPPPCDIGAAGWLIAGGAGADFADDIIFVTDSIGVLSGSALLGKNDDIDGLKPNGTRVILDGTGVSTIFGVSVSLGSASQVRNLEIRDFTSSGIFGRQMSGTIIEGNMIYNNGSDGITMLPQDEINLMNARNVRVGGPNLNQRNFIYGNAGNGIRIVALANDDRALQNIAIENNYIGTFDGTADQGNGLNGIYLEHTLGVTIGDPTGATRNVISGNNNDGIKISHTKSAANVIIGNLIGTNSAGNAPLGNAGSGVAFVAGAGWNDNVGGAPNELGRPGFGNVISSNGTGVFIGDSLTSRNIVKGNKIGTNLGGNLDLGNSNNGIGIGSGALNNQIGGGTASDANEIAYNGVGIFHTGAAGNMIRRNSIYANDGLGIDLAPAGVTPNDSLDADGGPNQLQNFPVVTSVRAFSSSATIEGTLNSAPNQSFIIDLYGNTSADPSGSGEGRTWLGGQQVATNASGNATFSVNLAVSIASVGQWVTATATDASNNTSEFSAARNICASPTASPTSIIAPVGGIASNFTFINSTGCAAPTVSSNRVWITGVGYSAGTVNFTVAANPGLPRDGAVIVSFSNGAGTGTLEFGVSQNNGCGYGMTASQATRPHVATTTNVINVTATDGLCPWSATSNASWITLTFVDGTGTGSVIYNVAANPGAPRIGTITVAQMTFTVLQAGRPAAFDFNGDGRTEIGIFRPNGSSGAEWWVRSSSNGSVWATTFGNSTDSPAPADYTGDTVTDVAVFRSSTGQWNILRSENFTYYAFPFGTNGDIAAPADFDGDLRADPAVFRPTNGTWYVMRSTGGTTIQQFGQNGDRPVAADYDRDGRGDLAIYRPSNGQWWINRSSAGVFAATFGTASDKPVPGDYTGDLRADIAFWRPSTGEWFILRSDDFSYYSFPFGTAGDLPAPGDYDGDGRYDATVFRPSNANWYSQRSTAGTLIQQFGAAGDRPIPNAFVP